MTSPRLCKLLVRIVGKQDDSYISPGEATRFRAMAASYLAADRPDIKVGVKHICREMATPTQSNVARVKRLRRHLAEHPRLWDYGREEKAGEDAIYISADSDWASCPCTRRSTGGGLVVVRGVAVTQWLSTKATVALSSGEAEHSLARAASEGLGVQALARGLGWKCSVALHADSSMAKGVAIRSGAGSSGSKRFARASALIVKRFWARKPPRSAEFVGCSGAERPR